MDRSPFILKCYPLVSKPRHFIERFDYISKISVYTPRMDSSSVNTNFARWGDALLTQSAKNVAALYASNAILLPTMGKHVIATNKGVEEYFAFFLTFLPRVSMKDEFVFGERADSYVHCGVYRFRLTRDGKEQEVDARFSMLWQKVNGNWMIVHHHSSQVPV